MRLMVLLGRGLGAGLVVLLVVGCRRAELEREPHSAPAVIEPATLPPTAAGVTVGLAGWSELAMRDTLPICVFPSYKARAEAQLLERAKRQTLPANSKLIFGVFGPWCLNEACDQRPTLQCWVDRKGDTLTINTRFSSLHKDGASCSEECMPLDTACETPELPPGKYTIKHGDKTHKLQLPSTLSNPCFGRP